MWAEDENNTSQRWRWWALVVCNSLCWTVGTLSVACGLTTALILGPPFGRYATRLPLDYGCTEVKGETACVARCGCAYCLNGERWSCTPRREALVCHETRTDDSTCRAEPLAVTAAWGGFAMGVIVLALAGVLTCNLFKRGMARRVAKYGNYGVGGERDLERGRLILASSPGNERREQD